MNNINRDNFSVLPIEIKYAIFQNLEEADFANLSATNQHLNEIFKKLTNFTEIFCDKEKETAESRTRRSFWEQRYEDWAITLAKKIPKFAFFYKQLKCIYDDLPEINTLKNVFLEYPTTFGKLSNLILEKKLDNELWIKSHKVVVKRLHCGLIKGNKEIYRLTPKALSLISESSALSLGEYLMRRGKELAPKDVDHIINWKMTKNCKPFLSIFRYCKSEFIAEYIRQRIDASEDFARALFERLPKTLFKRRLTEALCLCPEVLCLCFQEENYVQSFTQNLQEFLERHKKFSFSTPFARYLLSEIKLIAFRLKMDENLSKWSKTTEETIKRWLAFSLYKFGVKRYGHQDLVKFVSDDADLLTENEKFWRMYWNFATKTLKPEDAGEISLHLLDGQNASKFVEQRDWEAVVIHFDEDVCKSLIRNAHTFKLNIFSLEFTLEKLKKGPKLSPKKYQALMTTIDEFKKSDAYPSYLLSLYTVYKYEIRTTPEFSSLNGAFTSIMTNRFVEDAIVQLFLKDYSRVVVPKKKGQLVGVKRQEQQDLTFNFGNSPKKWKGSV